MSDIIQSSSIFSIPMDAQEVLRFADDLIFAKMGEHLDDLQKAILLGVWEG